MRPFLIAAACLVLDLAAADYTRIVPLSFDAFEYPLGDLDDAFLGASGDIISFTDSSGGSGLHWTRARGATDWTTLLGMDGYDIDGGNPVLFAANASVAFVNTSYGIYRLDVAAGDAVPLPGQDALVSPEARGLTADGLTIVGNYRAGAVNRVFLWSAAQGYTLGVGDVLGAERQFIFAGMAADASHVFGHIYGGASNVGLWKRSNGTLSLLTAQQGVIAGQHYTVTHVADKGDKALIWAQGESYYDRQLYVWSAGTGEMRVMDTAPLAGRIIDIPQAFSADGSAVAGNYSTPEGGWRTFLWKGNDLTLDLTAGIAGVNSSYARYIASDGSVVAGSYITSEGNPGSFRWTRAGGAVDLFAGIPGLQYGQISGMTSSGSALVGTLNGPGLNQGYVWTQADGLQTVPEWMQSAGIVTGSLEDWKFRSVDRITDDGNVIAGGVEEISTSTIFPFIARRDGGVADVRAWMSSVLGVNAVSSITRQLASLPMEGAHHRTVASYGDLGSARTFWVTGDFGGSSRGADASLASGEAGFSHALGQSCLLALAAGAGDQRQRLAYGGDAYVSGTYLYAEFDWMLPASAGTASLSVAGGRWDAAISRAYVTVAGVDYSIGESEADSRSLRLRYDSPLFGLAPGLSAGGFISVTWTTAEVDPYAEAGGAFPASFDRQKQSSEETRLGLLAVLAAGPSTQWRLTAELVHRSDQAYAALTGSDLSGALPFTLAQGGPRRDQFRAGIEVDHRLSDRSLISVSAHAAGSGNLPELTGAVTLRTGF